MSRTALVTLLVPLLVSPLVGCGDDGIQTPNANALSTTETEDVAPIRTDGARFLLVPGPVFTTVEIPFVYENQTDRTPYYLGHCNGAFDFRLEKRVGDEWVESHAPVLPECLSIPPIRIAPREKWRSSVWVYVSIQDGIEPEPIALEPEGTYRIVLSTLSAFDADVYPFGPSIPKKDRVSNPFALVIGE